MPQVEGQGNSLLTLPQPASEPGTGRFSRLIPHQICISISRAVQGIAVCQECWVTWCVGSRNFHTWAWGTRIEPEVGWGGRGGPGSQLSPATMFWHRTQGVWEAYSKCSFLGPYSDILLGRKMYFTWQFGYNQIHSHQLIFFPRSPLAPEGLLGDPY